MKIFEVNKIAEIDKYTIEHEPIASIDLMERAAFSFYTRFQKLFPHGDINILVGPGNNGGDALVIGRMLLKEGRNVRVWIIVPEDRLSKDGATNLQRLRIVNKSCVKFIDDIEQFDVTNKEAVIIDGLFGSGLNRPLKGQALELVQKVNSVVNTVVSIDIPSGLFGEDNTDNNIEGIIKADYTISFQFPKLSFMIADNEVFVGKWFVEEIGLHPQKINDLDTSYYYTEESEIASLLKTRGHFTHKGNFGHALLLAGNYGKMGAAILASRACLKSGIGLLTAHVPHFGYSIIQTAVPEAMASTDRSDILISEFPGLDQFSAVGIGPGIGTKPNTQSVLKELLSALNGKPIVMDADALNILALNNDLWQFVPENAVLTPHPGEFDRLSGKSNNSYERLQKAISFAKDKKVTIVLKGANTIVISVNGKCWFNSTGNPGMATAGSGDVLTGVILSLLAQGYNALDAARIGVYLHGLAGDLLLEEQSEEGIVATDIISMLGVAFKLIRR